jgi:hypothetical protein
LNPSGLFADVSIWGVTNNRYRGWLDLSRKLTHLATVYAPTRRLLAHDVNRREVKRIRIPATGRVLIGSANLGNYTDPPPDVRSDRVIRNLNGRIDEFVIFDQVLDAEAIQAIYDVGKPSS